MEREHVSSPMRKPWANLDLIWLSDIVDEPGWCSHRPLIWIRPIYCRYQVGPQRDSKSLTILNIFSQQGLQDCCCNQRTWDIQFWFDLMISKVIPIYFEGKMTSCTIFNRNSLNVCWGSRFQLNLALLVGRMRKRERKRERRLPKSLEVILWGTWVCVLQIKRQLIVYKPISQTVVIFESGTKWTTILSQHWQSNWRSSFCVKLLSY